MAALHEMDNMALTDQELEDFLSFMDHATPMDHVPTGSLNSGPLVAFPELSDEGGTADAAAAAAPTSSSDAHGSSVQHEAQRSPGSSDGCTAAAGTAGDNHGVFGPDGKLRVQVCVQHHHAQHAAMPSLGRLPEGEAYPSTSGIPIARATAPPAAPVPVPMPGSSAARLTAEHLGASAGSASMPQLLRNPSVASLGSLTMPLESLALGSPAVVGPLGADAGAQSVASAPAAASQPSMMVFSAGMPSYQGPFQAVGATPMVCMGAFEPHAGIAFMPAAALAHCGSAPSAMHGDATLASTLDGSVDALAGGVGTGAQQLSTSWPNATAPGGLAAAAASDGIVGGAAAAAGMQRSHSAGVSKPPSSGRSSSASRGRGSSSSGGDATYHRSSGGNGTLSHSTIEKQRRDRLNGLLDELGAMVPPSDGRGDGSRRPKHVILSDAIALLTSLQERLRIGCDEIAALKQRLAAAEAGGSSSVGGGSAIDIVAHNGSSGAALKSEPSSSTERMLPPTPSGTSPAELAPGMLRCASSDAELSLGQQLPVLQQQQQQQPCQTSVVVEQEGGSVRVAVSCHDRNGLLSDLVAALKATGATIAKASITTTGDGAARDDFELHLEDADVGLEDVRNAVLAVLSGAGAAAAGARGKRTRQ